MSAHGPKLPHDRLAGKAPEAALSEPRRDGKGGSSKPVLMTPECNLPEGFAAGAAIRIEPTVESIAQGLREVFELSARSVPLRLDREEGRGEVSNAISCCALRTLGANGRRLVAEKFAWPGIAARMSEVYEWVLGGGPRPGCVVE